MMRRPSVTWGLGQPQLEKFRELLQEARVRLVEPQELIDAGSEASKSFQHTLKRIDDALQRIDNEVYGICLTCVKPIHHDRLRHLPYAEHCLPCQQAYERSAQTKQLS